MAFEDGLFWDEEPKHSVKEALALRSDLKDEIKAAIKDVSHSDEEDAKWLEKMEDSPEYVPRMLWRMGRGEKPYDSQPALTHLHSIVWAHDDNKYEGSLAAGCFAIPSVRAVYLHRMSSYDDSSTADKRLSMIEHGSSACAHTEMHDCRLNEADIGNTDFGVIRDALQAHHEDLEDFWLDYGLEGIEWLEEVDNIAPMWTFKDFSKLRRFRIAPDFIFGANPSQVEEQDRDKWLLDFLPSSIKIIQLAHCDEYREILFKALEHLLVNNHTRVPSLSEMTLEITVLAISSLRFSGLLIALGCR
ncbi:hypothetical protein K469DRAFT_686334 [Zopfia rhizophila CBS 207.26]|uniref:Uncharacterized protein n=1 Tax=Zopfia rhizophila CBS 207.26 TaxID=1314779 RepID=A0A6A6E7Z1_9PEZI|nr:hypothetical protein K469DRAFT_686334 [Zopfia rhizophila CBS 207.26]